MRYFEAFPKIDYNNSTIRNILSRVRVLERTKQYGTVYHPFVINDFESPSKIAYDYYGSTDYTWIIFLVNNIVDPYYDWPLSSQEFDDFIIGKYGSLQAAQSQILHYKKHINSSWYVSISDPNEYYSTTGFTGDTSKYKLVTDDVQIIMSVESYDRNPDANFSPIYVYDHEQELNEQKRYIKLLDKRYARTMDKDLKTLLKI